MTKWYSADLHFFHANIIAHCARPFETVEAMNAALIENFSCVAPRDELWIIGDFAFGPGAKVPGAVEEMFHRLPGIKHLVVGNHDHKLVTSLPWASVSDLAEIRDDGQYLTLCHYPMITFNHARQGAMQLFGHVHNDWYGTRNSVNVGVDVWNYRPVRIDEIRARARDLPVNRHWADVEHGAEHVPEHMV